MKKKKKKNNTLKIVLSIIIVVIILIVSLLVYRIYGTIFQEVKISNNKSINYSNALIQKEYDDNINILISDITLNTNLAFFYAEGNEKVQNELNNYFKVDKDTLINNYNKIYDRYKYAQRRVSYANSLWINSNKEDCSKESKTTAKKLHYDIKSRKFNSNTKNEMNKWIEKRSHGKVKNAIEDGIDDAQSVLISTLYFNERWQEKYENDDINEGIFHGTTGNQQVTFLSSEEEIYLEDTTSKGFMRPYKDKGLYFIGIIPKEDYTIKDINVESLMKSRKDISVDVKIPEFEYEQTINLIDTLKSMNINSIFKEGNLDSIAKDLYVSKFIQKNYIKVDRKGTEAFSITVAIGAQWASISTRNTVILDQPFIFMIYDDTIDQVLFIGNVNNIK